MPRGLDSYTRDAGPLIALLGEPMSGKTSVIGALLDHTETITGLPFELNIVDMDRHLHPMFNEWGKSTRRDKTKLDRVWAVQTGDELRLGETGMSEPSARALEWDRIRTLSERFGDLGPGADKHEPYAKWGMNQVLVWDSVTAMIGAAFRHVMPGREGGFFVTGASGRKTLIHRDAADYGKAALAVGGLIEVLHHRPVRPYPTIMTFHLDHITITLSKIATDDEVEAAAESKAAREDLRKRLKDEAGIQVETEKMYPIVATKKQSRLIMRDFDYVLPVVRDVNGAPAVSTVSTPAVDARVPGQVGGLKKILPGSSALATIIQHHVSLSTPTPTEGANA